MPSDIVRRVEKELFNKERGPGHQGIRLFLRLAVIILTPLVLFEVGLRLGGYYRPQISMTRQNATTDAAAEALNDRLDTHAFSPDRHLLWRLDPKSNLAGLEVGPHGILGVTQVSDAPASGTHRILFLGDSTLALTYRTFPGIVARMISAVEPAQPVEVLNAGVPGYSTEQGLRRLPALLRLRPAVVFICFGWNDRFPALNLPDKDLGARNVVASLAHRLFHRSRIFQYLSAPTGAAIVEESETTSVARVGPRQFEANLRAMVAAVRDAGTQPVLVTQPALLDERTMAHLQEQGYVAGPLPPDQGHRAYNSIVRRTAAEMDAQLLDLDEEFNRRNEQWLFEPDGMHLSGPGHNLAARLTIGALQHLDVVTSSDLQRIAQLARFDTAAPDKPRAAWTLMPRTLESPPDTTATVSVIATNTGNSTWLRTNLLRQYGERTKVPFGGVSVVGKWRTEGAPTTAPVESRLRHDVLPGESTSQTLALRTPAAPGIYEMEIALRADGIGDLTHLGAEVTTLTVTVRPPE